MAFRTHAQPREELWQAGAAVTPKEERYALRVIAIARSLVRPELTISQIRDHLLVLEIALAGFDGRTRALEATPDPRHIEMCGQHTMMITRTVFNGDTSKIATTPLIVDRTGEGCAVCGWVQKT